jgi:hypothetical protein
VTRHHSCRVSPFGHPRIHARLTAPRGITQPPTSFIGSQCQGIHHAPLNTYNTKPKVIKTLKLHIHTHRKPPPPKRVVTTMRARCSQPLSTNQTPHPTTKDRGDNQSYPSPVSHTRDEEIAGLLSQSPIVCLMINFSRRFPTSQPFVVHQTVTHYRSAAIHRFAHGRGDPRYAGRPGSRGAP